MTDADAIVTNYDPETEEFKQIAARSLEKEFHCVYGPSFLLYEQGTKRFLESFCGTKATRSEAKKIYPFLPMTADDIARQKAAGNDVSGLEPHGPLPLTLEDASCQEGQVHLARSRRNEVPDAVHDADSGANRHGGQGLHPALYLYHSERTRKQTSSCQQGIDPKSNLGCGTRTKCSGSWRRWFTVYGILRVGHRTSRAIKPTASTTVRQPPGFRG